MSAVLKYVKPSVAVESDEVVVGPVRPVMGRPVVQEQQQQRPEQELARRQQQMQQLQM